MVLGAVFIGALDYLLSARHSDEFVLVVVCRLP